MKFFKTSDNVKLAYSEYGNSNDSVVLFVGGYTSNQATWVGQIEEFAKTHHVYTIDRRNHGASQTVDYGMRIARHGQDIHEFVEFLGLDSFDLIGHSMGASTVWSYISLYGDSKVNHIVSEDQSLKAVGDDSWPFGILNADWTNIYELSTHLRTTRLTSRDFPIEFRREIAKDYKPFNFELNQPLLINSLVSDWRDLIPQLTTPVLFIGAKLSPLWSERHAIKQAELNPNFASSFIFEDTGHIPHLESHELYNQVVLDFLSKQKSKQ